MKQFFISLLFVSSSFISIAQKIGEPFTTTAFSGQFAKLVCSGKTDFADITGKMVSRNGDTTWKTTLALPGFQFANLSKGNTAIDLAFVAYQSFKNQEEGLSRFEEVKQAIEQTLSTECIKMEAARIPMEVVGVNKYFLWKSTARVGYPNHADALLFVSLSLDNENEVVLNVFLKPERKGV